MSKQPTTADLEAAEREAVALQRRVDLLAAIQGVFALVEEMGVWPDTARVERARKGLREALLAPNDVLTNAPRKWSKRAALDYFIHAIRPQLLMIKFYMQQKEKRNGPLYDYSYGFLR
jgi:hypothetical protein